jgi:energy-dependent translational throttle protein EttA
MAPQYVYTMKGLGKTHPPDTVVLKDIWLSFLPGAKIGVLGANGAGKSTLLKIMAGVEQNYTGEAFAGEGVSIGFLEQEPQLNPAKDVRGNVEEGVADTRALLDRYDEINNRLGEELTPEEMEKLLDEQPGCRIASTRPTPGISTRGSRWRWTPCAAAGRRRREHSLGRRAPPGRAVPAAAAVPDLLLLDEPTNHLDAESVAWLERFLKDYPGTVVAVTHDRYFLDNVAGWILELDRATGYSVRGQLHRLAGTEAARLAHEEKAESKRQRTLQRELDWIRMSPRARQAKGKARLNAYEDLLAEDSGAEARIGRNLHSPRSAARRHRRGGAPPAQGLRRTGAVRRSLLHPAARRHRRRHRSQRRRQDDDVPVDYRAGDSRTGARCGWATPCSWLRGSVAGRARCQQERVRGDLGRVGRIEMGKRPWRRAPTSRGSTSRARQQQRKVGVLSGGERNRVHLAKLLRTGCNLLLLDEPTNDLDVDTLRALEEALLNFAGCAVVISHDRWFLDRIATHILAFEGDSQAVWFEGNYQDYEADRKRRLGAEADQPHRIKYRKLTRS